MSETPKTITELLHAARDGGATAMDDLLKRVYDELRGLARNKMRHLAAGATLQPTALVHEAYMRMMGAEDLDWENRRHFFGAAARAMRNILVDHAREQGALKRGGNRQRVSYNDELTPGDSAAFEPLLLEQPLQRLEAYDPRKCEIVMLRYYTGLTIAETAKVLGTSTATVEREWRYAKAWLHRELAREGDGAGDPA